MGDYQARLVTGWGMSDDGAGNVTRWEYVDGKERQWTETYEPRPRAETPCRVYWGSHGCRLERGHEGPHLCDCANDEGVDPETREYVDDPGVFNVGAPPYYGPDTSFYGEDA